MEIVLNILIIIFLGLLLYKLNNIQKEIKEIREGMLTKHSFESPLETFNRINGSSEDRE